MKTLILSLSKLIQIRIAGFMLIFIVCSINVNHLHSQGGPGVDKLKKPETPSVIATAPEDTTANARILPYRVSAVFLTGDTSSHTAGLNDKITVVVDSLSILRTEAKASNKRIIPYIDGKPLNGVYSVVSDEQLVFELVKDDSSRASWEKLLRKPSFFSGSKKVTLSVGFENGFPIPAQADNFSLSVYKPTELWMWFGVVFVLGILLLYYLGYREGMLRDPSQVMGKNGSAPFSLALTQMAFWYCLVVSSFLLLFLITKEIPKINGSVLALIGISSLTAWGSTAMNYKKIRDPKRKKRKLVAQQKALLERIDYLQKQQSKNPSKSGDLEKLVGKLKDLPKAKLKDLPTAFKDLVSDATGYSLYRVQIAIWTLILGCSFVYMVWENVEMPEFSETLLTLMGISSGAYLLFKIPEEKT